MSKRKRWRRHATKPSLNVHPIRMYRTIRNLSEGTYVCALVNFTESIDGMMETHAADVIQ